jgi:superfamily II DNA/RNA helicase
MWMKYLPPITKLLRNNKMSGLMMKWRETTKEERVYTPDEIEEIKLEIDALNEFKQLAQSIKINSKGEVLFTALTKGFEKLQELGANRKAIIFTESTRTQEYLKNILEARGYKDEIVLFNGSNNDPKSGHLSELVKKTRRHR